MDQIIIEKIQNFKTLDLANQNHKKSFYRILGSFVIEITSIINDHFRRTFFHPENGSRHLHYASTKVIVIVIQFWIFFLNMDRSKKKPIMIKAHLRVFLGE